MGSFNRKLKGIVPSKEASRFKKPSAIRLTKQSKIQWHNKIIRDCDNALGFLKEWEKDITKGRLPRQMGLSLSRGERVVDDTLNELKRRVVVGESISHNAFTRNQAVFGDLRDKIIRLRYNSRKEISKLSGEVFSPNLKLATRSRR